jgi:hypothetical protein
MWPVCFLHAETHNSKTFYIFMLHILTQSNQLSNVQVAVKCNYSSNMQWYNTIHFDMANSSSSVLFLVTTLPIQWQSVNHYKFQVIDLKLSIYKTLLHIKVITRKLVTQSWLGWYQDPSTFKYQYIYIYIYRHTHTHIRIQLIYQTSWSASSLEDS